MRNLLICFTLFLTFCSFAQTNGVQDVRFTGSWSGSEKDQQTPGLEKHWIQHRFDDGLFVLLFTTIQDGES